jgi:hypothetical protein
MAWISGKGGAAAGAQDQGLRRLPKLLTGFFSGVASATADDPVCLSGLDAKTLARYGYSERQIRLMKESSFRLT